jgi:hypothetical protein
MHAFGGGRRKKGIFEQRKSDGFFCFCATIILVRSGGFAIIRAVSIPYNNHLVLRRLRLLRAAPQKVIRENHYDIAYGKS